MLFAELDNIDSRNTRRSYRCWIEIAVNGILNEVNNRVSVLVVIADWRVIRAIVKTGLLHETIPEDLLELINP